MDPDPLSKASLEAKPTAPPTINVPPADPLDPSLDPALDPSVADSHPPSIAKRTPPPTHPSRTRSASPRRLPPAPDSSAPPPLPSPATRARYLAPTPTPGPTPKDSLTPQVSRTQTPNATSPPAEDSYIRDPHRLIAYIVPFPAPTFASDVPPPPARFLIYTPPPPPLLRPSPSQFASTSAADSGTATAPSESRAQKVQRKWQEEVRAAHESEHKVMSWGGIKARVTRGVDWAVGHVTSADLDFLTRVPKDGEAHLGGGYVHKPASGGAVPGDTTVDAAAPGGGETTTPAVASALHTSVAMAAAADAPVAPAATPVGTTATGAYAKEAEAAQDRVDEPAGPPAYTATDGSSGNAAAASSTTSPALPPRRRSSRSSDSIPPLHESPHTLVNDEDPLAPESTAPTQATVKLDEMVLIYPPSMPLSHDELQAEFVHSLLRTKSKAQRDTIIATGLLPVTLALDWALVFVGWVFGGALEVDAVWLASSFRGAKTARSVTKRLASTSSAGHEALKLTFKASQRADLLAAYLRDKCVAADRARYDAEGRVPSSYEVLDSIGWEAAGKYDEHNWEDEKWERRQVEADLATTMGKAASAWKKWCDRYEKDPEKALKR